MNLSSFNFFTQFFTHLNEFVYSIFNPSQKNVVVLEEKIDETEQKIQVEKIQFLHNFNSMKDV